MKHVNKAKIAEVAFELMTSLAPRLAVRGSDQAGRWLDHWYKWKNGFLPFRLDHYLDKYFECLIRMLHAFRGYPRGGLVIGIR